MIKKSWIGVACILVFAIGCSKSDDPTATSPTATGTPPATGSASPATTGAAAAGGYAAVQGIFTKSCVGCHGIDHPKGGISLTNYAAVIKGGKDGPIVTKGDPDKSKLVDALRGSNGAMQMPKGQPPLPETDIKTVEDWIKAGANDS